VEADQIHVLATTMLRHPEKIMHVFEAAGARDLQCDVLERNRQDRINFDLTFLHSVPLAYCDVTPLPYANGARNTTGTNSVAQILYKQHVTSLRRDS
jgi:hypothetical protein